MMNYAKRVFFLLILLSISGFFWSKLDWTSVNKSIDSQYPSVASISTQSLKEKMEQQEVITIIDVRDSEEFDVSHLRGAINVHDASGINLPIDTSIVVYCSVGIRSAQFAKRLTKRGYTDVLNLRGSIFEWANKGYPLQRGEQNVTVVHPYNKRWGSLLKESLHAYDKGS